MQQRPLRLLGCCKTMLLMRSRQCNKCLFEHAPAFYMCPLCIVVLVNFISTKGKGIFVLPSYKQINFLAIIPTADCVLELYSNCWPVHISMTCRLQCSALTNENLVYRPRVVRKSHGFLKNMVSIPY